MTRTSETRPKTLSDRTLTPGRPTSATRSRLSNGVRAVIARRAVAAGISDFDYFREIIAGRAPRVTRLEAAREPLG